jgi:hypothetical protein
MSRALSLLSSAPSSQPLRAADAAYLATLLHPSQCVALQTTALEALCLRQACGESLTSALSASICAAATALASAPAPAPALLARAVRLLTMLCQSQHAPLLLASPALHALAAGLLARDPASDGCECTLATVALVNGALLRAPPGPDALVAAGLLPFLARAAAAHAWAPLSYQLSGCVRNATTGSEARKDAGVAAGLGPALAALLPAHLAPSPDDSAPCVVLRYSSGAVVQHPLDPGYSSVRKMALNGACMALATLASDTGGVLGPGSLARVGALLGEGSPVLPELVSTWRLHRNMPGALAALHNCGTTPARRNGLRAAAGALGCKLLSALGLPLN